MKDKSILIIDDEKNIRFTLVQCLEPLGYHTDTAINAEAALEKLQEKDFHLILLDLKLPGMDGLEFLRKLHAQGKHIKTIIITAHGTVESAVDAMKLGAVDFIQKPFSPREIRDVVTQVLQRDSLDEHNGVDYQSQLALAKKCIVNKKIDEAVAHVRKAISFDPSKAEIFELMGVLMEIKGDLETAEKNYRAALALDPDYLPAQKSLHRIRKSMKKLDNIVIRSASEA